VLARILGTIGAIAGLAAVQLLIARSPAELIPSHQGAPAARAYRVDAVTPYAVRLTLYGPRARLAPGDVRLVQLVDNRQVWPLQNSSWVIPSGMSRLIVTLQFSASPGTYKLALPGVEPFGDFSVGQR
jgi:hypothetical protein